MTVRGYVGLSLLAWMIACGGDGRRSVGARVHRHVLAGLRAVGLGGRTWAWGEAPAFPELVASPTHPKVGEALRCADAEGSDLLDVVWRRDGNPVIDGPAVASAPGEVWTCTQGARFAAPVVVGEAPVARNVLIVVLDDVGWLDVGASSDASVLPHGSALSAASTPRIDALAAEGVTVTTAWAEPVCSPTRASLLTGLHPLNHGLGTAIGEHGGDKEVELHGDHRTVADLFHAVRGGRTGAFGKWHLGGSTRERMHPASLGFDAWSLTLANLGTGEDEGYEHWTMNRNGSLFEESGYVPEATIRDALAFIDASGETPWMAWVALHLAHAPYHLPPTSLAPVPIPEGNPVKFLSMVQAADTLVGRLLDGLGERRSETLILLVGDNGTPQSAARPPLTEDRVKTTVFEPGVRVPMVWVGPGLPAGTRRLGPVGVVDLMPTLADLLGEPLTPQQAASVDGRSVAAHLRVGSDEGLGPVYAEIYTPSDRAPEAFRSWHRAVRDRRWKLVDDNGVRHLYDLVADPWELRDVASRHGEVVTRLAAAFPPPRDD